MAQVEGRPSPLSELLEALDDEQRTAVEAPERTLRILAGAGSGKTRVLTLRVAARAAAGQIDPRRVLALTFTRRAAIELGDRLGALGIRDLPLAGTFHAVARAQLLDWWSERGRPIPAMVEDKTRFLTRTLLPGEVTQARAVAAEADWAAARLVSPDGYEDAVRRNGRRVPVPPGRVAELLRSYREEKRRRGVVDFDDLLTGTLDVLRRDPEFARAQRWRFRHLVVDEFQDLNPLQFRLLGAWLGEDDEPDLCVVGDPAQSIYRWNGADARFLVRFAERFPRARTVELRTNYRSTPGVLATAAAVLGVAPQRARRPDGPPPTLQALPDEEAEAKAVAAAVLEAARNPGRTWASQAVLARTHAQVTLLCEHLCAAGIPARVRLDTRPGDAGSSVVDDDVVEVVTFHAAKGLEWPVVHVAGLEEGLVPHASARGEADLAEERRLLYVALTRAERELHLSWARRRRFGTRVHDRRPTRWLADARAELTGPEPPPAIRATVPAGPSPTSRMPVARAPEARPPPLQARLERWRERQARAARVPPHVVVGDITLVAIAERRPRDLSELAEVPGMGRVRASRLGEDLLAIVAGDDPTSEG